MRHRNKGRVLGKEKAPREALLRNLAASIVLYEKVKTTEAKAKEVRSMVEKAITVGKSSDLHSRRKLEKIFYTDGPVRKIIEVLGPKYKDRKGGYTRITKIGPRQGDAAKMVQIELV